MRIRLSGVRRERTERNWHRAWCAVLDIEYSTVAQWIRDLHEEGIEPHPGPNPSFVSKNVRGISAVKEFSRLLSPAREVG